MVWAKLVSESLTSTVSDYTTSTYTPNTFQTIIYHYLANGSSNCKANIRVGNTTIDTGTNYSWRKSTDGGTDTSSASTSVFDNTRDHNSGFVVCYQVNIATEEKLFISFNGGKGTAGADNAPQRAEAVGKWSNTSNQSNIFQLTASPRTMIADTNVTILGSNGVESMTVQDGAVFYETDTNKSYVLYSDSWSEL